jgi:hypothetical protein
MFRLLFSGLTATVLIAFGLFLVFAGHKNSATFGALNDRGVVVRADVTQVEWHERRASRTDSLYTAHVRFRTQDGRVINTSLYVPAELGRALRSAPSPTMSVRYLPESPTTVEDVNKSDPSGEQSDIGVMMVLLGALMLAVRFVFAKRRESRERATSVYGRSGTARSVTHSRR